MEVRRGGGGGKVKTMKSRQTFSTAELNIETHLFVGYKLAGIPLANCNIPTMLLTLTAMPLHGFPN